jgi:hypothetical protein
METMPAVEVVQGSCVCCDWPTVKEVPRSIPARRPLMFIAFWPITTHETS